MASKLFTRVVLLSSCENRCHFVMSRCVSVLSWFKVYHATVMRHCKLWPQWNVLLSWRMTVFPAWDLCVINRRETALNRHIWQEWDYGRQLQHLGHCGER